MKYLLLLVGLSVGLSLQAQEAKSKKITESTFEVKGVCGMCKDRIESAAMRTTGVKLAEWNKETKQLKVVYKTKKTTEEEIQKAIAMKGHASESMPKDSAAYEKLPNCCKYADGAECTH
ncbi:MAG: heavy-metal-associated domain-containing protein [Vicingaceae bacterium]